MDNIFDIAPFPYVGNNKHYRDLSKDELDKLKMEAVKENPTSDEVEENAVVNMLPQVGLTAENETPDVEDILADAEEDKIENLFDEEEMRDMQIDEEFDLLKESLDDEVNGSDIYFESSKFIESLKAKFKKDKETDPKKIAYNKIMKAAKAYTDLKFVDARKKIAVTKDSSIKDTIEFKKYQKKAIAAEKDFRKLKAELTPEEVKILDQYIENFNSNFADKIEVQVKDIEDAKKAAIKKESVDTIDDEIDIQESVAVGVSAALIGGLIAYSVVKTKKGNEKIKKCIDILKKTDSSFIDPNDMTVKRYKIRDTLNDGDDKHRGKEITNKLLKLLAGRYIDVYSYNGKEIFSYVSDYDSKVSSGVGVGTDGSVAPTISVERTPKFYFKLIDTSLSKFKDCYLAFATNKAKYKQVEAWNWAEDFVNNHEEDVKKESCETECGDSEIVTEKDIDPGMKPILDKLHSKGYKTKASSSGHKNVTTKKDGDEDNIRDDHHYGDARLVFDGKYNLGKAPKYWYWKKVDNADEVDYLDIMQIKNEEWPDNGDKFAAWKTGYMKSLSEWVDSLPNVSDKKEDVKESAEDIDDQIDTLYESVIGSLMLDVLDI